MPLPRSPLTAAACAVFITSGLVLGGGVAVAQDTKPITGSAECVDTVEDAGTVSQARDNLSAAESDLATAEEQLKTAQDNLASRQAAQTSREGKLVDLKAQLGTVSPGDLADLQAQIAKVEGRLANDKTAIEAAQKDVDAAEANVDEAEGRVSTARSLLAQARVAATANLCSDAAEETTPPATTPPADEDPAPFVDKDCSDFTDQAAAQAFYNSVRTDANPDPARLDANHNGIACENPADEVDTSDTTNTTINNTEINNGVVVNPTDDDDSTANVDGTQVEVVPDGSAQTGDAA